VVPERFKQPAVAGLGHKNLIDQRRGREAAAAARAFPFCSICLPNPRGASKKLKNYLVKWARKLVTPAWGGNFAGKSGMRVDMRLNGINLIIYYWITYYNHYLFRIYFQK